MKSPFPGMAPYLEAFWYDIYPRLTIYASDAIQRGLPKDLRARIETQVYIEAPISGDRRIKPDVLVVERPRAPERTLATPEEGGVAVAESIIVHMPEIEQKLRSIQILDLRNGGRVVTSIEFLSLANKVSGRGQELHLLKQAQLKEAGVNLVEIDLLRDGDRVMILRPEHIPARARTTYQIVCWRAHQRESYEVFRAPLRQRLPRVTIPLREHNPDVTLDLQALIDQVYENAEYDDIDYRAEPDPRSPTTMPPGPIASSAAGGSARQVGRDRR